MYLSLLLKLLIVTNLLVIKIVVDVLSYLQDEAGEDIKEAPKEVQKDEEQAQPPPQ